MMRAIAKFAVALVVMGFALFAASPASAAPTDVEFSVDNGATWSASPPSSLFPAAFRVVPGDSLTSTLLVRSTHATPVVAMIAITNATVSGALFDAALTVGGQDASGAGLAPTRLSTLGVCDQLVPTRVLATGDVVSVTVTVSISTTLTQLEAQNAAAGFDLAVGLSDPGAPTSPNGCAVDPTVVTGFPTATTGAGAGVGVRVMAYTGIDSVYPSLITAAIALGVGWCLMLVARRRRSREQS